VKPAIFLCLCAAACRQPQAAHPPIAAECTLERIGKVTVTGGSAADVPQLAVLEGTLDNEERTARVTTLATEMLRAHGYARASVRVARRIGCGVELTVAVDRGPRFRISEIAFQTDDEFPAEARGALIEDELGTVNTVGGAYVADRLSRALALLERRYQELGWLDAKVDAPVPHYDDRHRVVAVTIPIRAGRRFKIGNVVARGGKRATRAAVIEALGLRGGQWYDAARIREGLVRARREVDDRIQMHMAVASDRIDVEALVGDER
jgi:outer membrane protein assembly factor BamA